MRTNGCCQPARMRLPVYTILVVRINLSPAQLSQGRTGQGMRLAASKVLLFAPSYVVLLSTGVLGDVPLTSSLRGVRSDVTKIIRTARYCLSAISLTGIIRTAGYCLSALQSVIGTAARESDH